MTDGIDDLILTPPIIDAIWAVAAQTSLSLSNALERLRNLADARGISLDALAHEILDNRHVDADERERRIVSSVRDAEFSR